MKEFRKNEQGLFICEECSKPFETREWLSRHVNIYHNAKNYYDKWINENNDKCIVCKKDTKFITIGRGYKNTCSKECIKKLRKETTLQLYGVENTFQSEEIKEKCKQTHLKNSGVNHNFKDKKCIERGQQTKLKRYGNKNFNNREKCKQTCLKLYGVEYNTQNINIFNKGLKTRFLIHKYKDTNVTYQSSYELDFLDKFYNKFKIENGLSIKYEYNGKNKVYHSDFYIPYLNLIIEIKSCWTLTQDIEVEEKKKATIANGFKYLMILDKDYSSLSAYSPEIPAPII